MPKTPLRITIGRTYMWYDLMGEFAGVYDRLLADGDVCKYCGRTRYCEWPAADPASGRPGRAGRRSASLDQVNGKGK